MLGPYNSNLQATMDSLLIVSVASGSIHRSTTNHLVSLKRNVQDTFSRQHLGLWNSLVKWHHPRPAREWPLAHTACFRGGVSQGTLNSSQNRHHTLWRILYRRACPYWWCISCCIFGLKLNELPPCFTRDIFRESFVVDLEISFLGHSLDTIKRHLQQAINAIQEWATRNWFRFEAHKCKKGQLHSTPIQGWETAYC